MYPCAKYVFERFYNRRVTPHYSRDPFPMAYTLRRKSTQTLGLLHNHGLGVGVGVSGVGVGVGVLHYVGDISVKVRR